MKADTRSRRIRLLVCITFLVGLLTGCGGSGKDGIPPTPTASGDSQGGATERRFGSLVSRVVGTAQLPVTSTGVNTAVTAIVGATISSLVNNNYAAPTLRNTRIAFNRSGALWPIFTINPDGTDEKRITSDNTENWRPVWSPDNSKIAFERWVNGRHRIFVMNADGSAVTQITSGSMDAGDPQWSPGGTKIAFTRGWILEINWQASAIWVMNADGSGVTQVSTGSEDSKPFWSPRGDQILFQRGYNMPTQLFVMDANGGNVRQITSGDNGPYYSFAWSPDGAKIAFSRPVNYVYQIFTMNPDGSGFAQITSSGSNSGALAWSPDSANIVFDRYVGADRQLFTMTASGDNVTQITSGSGYNINPSWSHSPAVAPPVLIGSGGALGTEAAGFLFGRQGDTVTSVVVFDTAAKTTGSRAAVSVSAQTSLDSKSPNLIFTLSASTSIGSLGFVTYSGSLTPSNPKTVPIPTATTGVLLDFNAATGQVSGVLPYAANRGVGNCLKSVREGDTLVYRAGFTGYWNAEGKNLAPHGASTVRINRITGGIISVQ